MPLSRTTTPLPPVLRSWKHLQAAGLAPTPPKLPIEKLGTTYTMAQELTWLDSSHFAVGRWDGTLELFRFNQSNQGPLISKAVTTPSCEGVQMITLCSPKRVVTSNDQSSILCWSTTDDLWTDFSVQQVLNYESALGVANSGVYFRSEDGATDYLVVGHESGFVSIWAAVPGDPFVLSRTVDLRSVKPVNPWGLHNIRGLSLALRKGSQGWIVSGSEDGDLCVISVPDGVIVSRTVYNPNAQRGINSIDFLGGYLIVANCAVGNADSNLWCYEVTGPTWKIVNTDSARLVADATLAQVFNFDVVWGSLKGAPCWYSATEEGCLWMGTVKDGKLVIIGNQTVTAKLGAAIGSLNSSLALVAHDLYEFSTGQA